MPKLNAYAASSRKCLMNRKLLVYMVQKLKLETNNVGRPIELTGSRNII